MRRSIHAILSVSFLLPATIHAQRQTERDAFTWSGAIPSGRWIIVRNLSGRIEVTSSTSDRVEVTATKRWRDSDPRSVRFEVRKSGANDEDITICALWNDRTRCDERGYEANRVRDNDVSADFRVAVPRGVKVAASSINGAVRVDGATSEVDASSVNGEVSVTSAGGPVNASTTNGRVTARMGRFEGNDDLTFETVNGSVVVEFTGDLDADVELTTTNGRFRSDYPVTVSGRFDPRHLRARLGKGGRRVRLTTVNGNVELRRRDG
jgi:hypothetical protein